MSAITIVSPKDKSIIRKEFHIKLDFDIESADDKILRLYLNNEHAGDLKVANSLLVQALPLGNATVVRIDLTSTDGNTVFGSDSVRLKWIPDEAKKAKASDKKDAKASEKAITEAGESSNTVLSRKPQKQLLPQVVDDDLQNNSDSEQETPQETPASDWDCDLLDNSDDENTNENSNNNAHKTLAVSDDKLESTRLISVYVMDLTGGEMEIPKGVNVILVKKQTAKTQVKLYSVAGRHESFFVSIINKSGSEFELINGTESMTLENEQKVELIAHAGKWEYC